LCQGGKDIQHLKCKQYNPFKSRVPEVRPHKCHCWVTQNSMTCM
jgi:hypothetical protein